MQKRCPGCGSPYNGVKCRICYYAPFPDAAHTSYEHPVPENAPPRRQLPQTRRLNGKRVRIPFPARQQRKSGRKPGRALTALLAALLFGSGVFTTVIGNLFDDLDTLFFEEAWVEEYETPALPEGGKVLYENADVQIIAGWQEGMALEGNLPIYVVNHTSRDLSAFTAYAAVNGCMADSVFFYCDAPAGRTAEGMLWLDGEELALMGIDTIMNVSFDVEIRDEDYEPLLEGIRVTLNAPNGEGVVQPLDDSGLEVMNWDGFRLVYQGCTDSGYGDIRFLFYAENTAPHAVELSGEELLVNNAPTGQYLWKYLLPGTHTLICIDLYDLESLGLTDYSQVQSLSLPLTAATGMDAELASHSTRLQLEGPALMRFE